MKTTMCLEVERSQSSGQLQKPFSIASTPLPVMSGVMAASSMRYGHLDTNHSMNSTMHRFVLVTYDMKTENILFMIGLIN